MHAILRVEIFGFLRNSSFIWRLTHTAQKRRKEEVWSACGVSSTLFEDVARLYAKTATGSLPVKTLVDWLAFCQRAPHLWSSRPTDMPTGDSTVLLRGWGGDGGSGRGRGAEPPRGRGMSKRRCRPREIGIFVYFLNHYQKKTLDTTSKKVYPFCIKNIYPPLMTATEQKGIYSIGKCWKVIEGALKKRMRGVRRNV